MNAAEGRWALAERGVDLARRWCDLNDVTPPAIRILAGKPRDRCGDCGGGLLRVWPDNCAFIGRAGRAWSYPGHHIDRTPYGVTCHELGHHVERRNYGEGGAMAGALERSAREEKLTGYGPNASERFAEWFRLFVTNPDLLRALRPKTFEALAQRWPNPAEARHWREVLQGSPRHLRAAEKKVSEVPGGGSQHNLFRFGQDTHKPTEPNLDCRETTR